jgi:hypothetical protein
MLFAYLCFYARYTVWSGDFAWGDRYVSTAAELASLLAVPLFVEYLRKLNAVIRLAGSLLICTSAAIQAASLAFWLPLEIYQRALLGPRFVLGLRFENIVAFALHRMEAWGLFKNSITDDPWDYVHITCWNFLPFLLGRVGEAPAWVVRLTLAAWLTALAILAWVLWRLYKTLNRGDDRVRRVEASPS